MKEHSLTRCIGIFVDALVSSVVNWPSGDDVFIFDIRFDEGCWMIGFNDEVNLLEYRIYNNRVIYKKNRKRIKSHDSVKYGLYDFLSSK